MRIPKVRFQGQEFILAGGALATREQFESGKVSFAYVCDDGMIRRLHKIIGTSADLETIGEEEVTVSAEMVVNALSYGLDLLDLWALGA